MNKDLIAYINKEIAKGFSLHTIKRALLDHGYEEGIISEAFSSVMQKQHDIPHIHERDSRRLKEWVRETFAPQGSTGILPVKKGILGGMIIGICFFLYIGILSLIHTKRITCYYPGIITSCSGGSMLAGFYLFSSLGVFIAFSAIFAVLAGIIRLILHYQQ